MNRIPHSQDELMWLIAEGGDPATVDSFVRRHPEHRKELYRRLQMVQSLKNAGKPVPGRKAPLFEPRALKEGRSLPRWVWYPIAAVGLFGFGFASYSVVTRLQHQTPDPAQTSSGAGVKSDLPTADRQREKPLPAHPTPAPPTEDPTGTAPVARAVDPVDRPVTLELEKTTLIEALNSLSAASGVKFEIAPGTPNPELRLSYHSKPLRAILGDLGSVAGVTALVQDGNSVLIVPATDPNAAPAPAEVAGGASALEADPPRDDPGTNTREERKARLPDAR